jgi:hypothetical protein
MNHQELLALLGDGQRLSNQADTLRKRGKLLEAVLPALEAVAALRQKRHFLRR